MGRAIEQVLLSRNHSISYIFDKENTSELANQPDGFADVAIEFTEPHAAPGNILACLQKSVPIVSGSTGWLDRLPEIREACEQHKGAFFYASNYSLGVNLFFRLNRMLAELMAPHPDFKVGMKEIHHIHKKDAPSGTGITLAQGIIEKNARYKNWELVPKQTAATTSTDSLPIVAIREGEVPGTHEVMYESANDLIAISHIAKGREGFALGAVIAAEWIQGKTGVFGMDDLLARDL